MLAIQRSQPLCMHAYRCNTPLGVPIHGFNAEFKCINNSGRFYAMLMYPETTSFQFVFIYIKCMFPLRNLLSEKKLNAAINCSYVHKRVLIIFSLVAFCTAHTEGSNISMLYLALKMYSFFKTFTPVDLNGSLQTNKLNLETIFFFSYSHRDLHVNILNQAMKHPNQFYITIFVKEAKQL